MKTTNTINIVSLKNWQLNEATDILTDGFNNDPVFRYVTPEEARSKAIALRWLCEKFLHSVSPYQHIYTTDGTLKGVAAWVPPEHSHNDLLPLSDAELAQLKQNLGSSHKIERFISVFSTFEARHRQDVPHPHWYLYALAVSSAYQRQGIGGSLIQPILQQADKDGVPCYLFTSTESAVRFYQRHGFEVTWMGETLIDSPYIWTMKREPK
jgi:ribosomal protein S18 acetylase RimI-like enzyme